MVAQPSSGGGYSPEISAELLIRDQVFKVAAIGAGGLVIHSPHPVEPGEGTIRMLVDGRETVYQVEIPDGIDPSRDRQPFKVLPTVEASAANPESTVV